MQWSAGTSGFSYKAWKGSFYPADLADDAMLGFYASRLPAVEINNTFYRMPKRSVLETWAAAVPDDFRFVIKASRRITHMQRLEDAGEPTAYLVKNLAALGDKLGAVLFQLPPNLRRDDGRLERFLRLLPPELPKAFEFRHASWHDKEVHALLAEAGAALCVADDESAEAPELVATATWTYLRLRRPDYSDAALQMWDQRARAAGAERGFAFFKHEDAAAGPALAERFLQLTGEPATAAQPARAGRRRKGPAATAAKTPARRRPDARRA